MGRIAGLSNDGVQKGAWTSFEDQILTSYVQKHGEGKWRTLPMRAGLKRCGKSCRLRWLNYLKPGIKRGNISREEDDLIIKLHTTFGNSYWGNSFQYMGHVYCSNCGLWRWSLIAGQLPGRTDNEIKNYWNTTLQKRLLAESSESSKQKSVSKSKEKTTSIKPPPTKATPPATAVNNDELPENFVEPEKDLGTQENSMESETHEVPPSTPFDDSSIISSMMNFDMEELWTTSYSVDNDFWQVYQNGIQADNDMISEDHDFFLQPYDFQALEPYDFQALELFLHEEEDGCDYTGCV